MPLPLPFSLSVREFIEDIDKRLERLPTELNEYGFDPYGLSPEYARRFIILGALLYRHYFRVETHGIEHLPAGRVLVVANHAGNTIPWDGVMLGLSLVLEPERPRMVRGMAEFYLPRIPWWSELIHRVGAVVGTPENCIQLLEREEAIIIMPEGHRGFIKPYTEAYKLQRFGNGFVRLALQTGTPVLPAAIIGAEEQSPGLFDSKFLARLIGAPAFPITATWPLLGPLGFLVPLPVKFRLRFGEPIYFEPEGSGLHQSLEEKADFVKDRIALLIEEGLAERDGWFA
jgi:1-acyl-sn-glycerol-3-phosphate acyltransferase